MIRIAFVLALVAGCYPATTTTLATTRRELSAIEPGPARDLVIALERHDSAVVVSASWPRRCKGRIVDHVTRTTSTSLRLAGTSDGNTWGYGLLAPMIIFYPVGLADLAIAGTAALAEGSSSSEEARVHDSVETSCDIAAAHVAIQLVLASGSVIDGTTDDRGEVVYLLPDGAVPRTVRAGNPDQVMPDTEVRFRR